jgi:hypothetical protein
MGKFDDISLTPEDFGNTASTHTVLTGPQLVALFPSEAERQAFRDLLELVEAAKSDNDKRTDFLQHANQFAGIVLKLVRKTVLGL